ncbi:MAG: DEAD/DEAH box helicase, partial [Deltaproteobacteria bacterium]
MELGLRPELLQALAALGYEEPTPVQRAAIPPLLLGRDVVAQAATGTGKTAAFALPLLQRLEVSRTEPGSAAALVLVPTRELALQVSEAIHAYGRTLGATVLAIYGGQPFAPQLQKLRRGAHVVVATPGRTLDHLRRKTLRLGSVRTVVLDEADEMLDLGFADDLEAILGTLPATRQTALFSATLPPRIAAIAAKHLRDPVRLRIQPSEAAQGTLPRIRQVAYVVPKSQKEIALGRLLDVEAPRSALIFCRTRLEAGRVAGLLASHGQDVAELHGGLSQEQRDQVIRRFKSRKLRIVVATDVAARGLDVDDLSHVINFDPPTSPEVYVHRIGRTGRAGKEGRAVTLLEPRELRLLKAIERLTGQPIELGKPPSVSELRDRRLAATEAAVTASRAKPIPEPFRALAQSLSQDAGPEEALA